MSYTYYSKLTVITVVLDDASRIQATIDSVMEQDYKNIEYIIKDGGSTDETKDIIMKAMEAHDNIKYVSADDTGLYDAMNIALLMSSGDVVQFLNAGDRLAEPDVASRAMEALNGSRLDIVYGDVLYENPDGTSDVRTYPQSCSSLFYYLTGDCINHQCIFARRSLFSENGFDTSYRICADREWMLRVGAYTPRCKMKALGFVTVIYPLDGISVTNKELYRKEAAQCIKRYIPWGYPIYAMFEFCRSHKGLSDVLHKIYRRRYIK